MINAEIHLTANLTNELQEELINVYGLKINSIELLNLSRTIIIDTHVMITKRICVKTYKELQEALELLVNLVSEKLQY